MNRHPHGFWIAAILLGAECGPFVAAQNPEITDLQNGYASWTNANTNRYYTLEFSSALTNGSPWDGAYRGWQDLRSTSSVFTVPIGRFYRVVASSNPLHTATLSPASAGVAAGRCRGGGGRTFWRSGVREMSQVSRKKRPGR